MEIRKTSSAEQYIRMRRRLSVFRNLKIVALCAGVLISASSILQTQAIVGEADDEPLPSTPVVEQVVMEEPKIEVEEPVSEVEIDHGVTDEEIELIALVTMAEAEGECEEGKRLVIDTILNRVDNPRFPDTIRGVIYAPHQFTSMWNGRVDRCYVREDICKLVEEELANRLNTECLYFRTNHYHNFGTPLVQVGNHYFSGQ